MKESKILSSYSKHPTERGVFLKHFFSSHDNDYLSSVEVRIEPGCEIRPHIHEKSTEFYYISRGRGLFLVGENYEYIREGEAAVAPDGITHGIKNDGSEVLILLATFAPALR